MTKGQQEVLSTLLKGGDITIQEAVDKSGFSFDLISSFVGIGVDKMKEKADVKVSELPFGWRIKLKAAALKLGVTGTTGYA